MIPGTMAVASDRAGQVLARPLFRRLNVNMHTLNTYASHTYIRTSKPSHRPSRLGKQLPIIVQISVTKR